MLLRSQINSFVLPLFQSVTNNNDKNLISLWLGYAVIHPLICLIFRIIKRSLDISGIWDRSVDIDISGIWDRSVDIDISGIWDED